MANTSYSPTSIKESLPKSTNQIRLLVLTGDLKGQSFTLNNKRSVIGRSDKADVKINDTKASREHVEIASVDGKFLITDLGSQNGVLLNDKKILQAELYDGDKIIIGQTVLKVSFFQQAFKKTNLEIPEELPEKKIKSNNTFRIIIIALILFTFIIWLSAPSPEKGKPEVTNFVGNYSELDNQEMIDLEKKKARQDKKNKEKLVVFYQRGLRELREKNYFRAIQEFNLALNYSPSDGQAEYYIRKAKEELDREIEGNVAKAIRDEESLKFKSALISYCAIIRLLHSVPEDPRYKNAEKQLIELELKLGMNPGEADCLKKQRSYQ